jgi:hypothetical protein
MLYVFLVVDDSFEHNKDTLPIKATQCTILDIYSTFFPGAPQPPEGGAFE